MEGKKKTVTKVRTLRVVREKRDDLGLSSESLETFIESFTTVFQQTTMEAFLKDRILPQQIDAKIEFTYSGVLTDGSPNTAKLTKKGFGKTVSGEKK